MPAGEAAGFANGKGKKLYVAYQERLKTLNAADFGDLLLENIRLFRSDPEVLRQYQQRFKFILVDEYQDTNVAQYLWLRLLAQSASHRHSGSREARCPEMRASRAVKATTEGHGLPRSRPCGPSRNDRGKNWRAPDDARKTSAASAMTTSRSMAGAARRSTTSCASTTISPAPRSSGSNAITAAPATSWRPPRHLIAHNEGRLGKTLRTEDVPGEKVQVTGGWDSEEEARSIGEEIEQLQRDAREQGLDHPLDEIAILVRASFQMREFEDRFIQLGLPYRVIGGPRFYERAEIRDALAYLRVIAQPADDLAFERIVNVPKRGLGDATVQMLHDYARKQRIPLTEAAAALSATDEMKPKPRGALRELMATFERWRAQKDTHAAHRAGRDRARRDAATPRCGRTTKAPTPPAGWKTSRSWCARWRNSRTSPASSSTSRW